MRRQLWPVSLRSVAASQGVRRLSGPIDAITDGQQDDAVSASALRDAAFLVPVGRPIRAQRQRTHREHRRG
jgi:hypothetical protein